MIGTSHGHENTTVVTAIAQYISDNGLKNGVLHINHLGPTTLQKLSSLR